WRESCKPTVALRENLENVPIRLRHEVEHAADERERDAFVEEVRHRVHEDQARSTPAKWLLEAFGMEYDVYRLELGEPRLAGCAEPERDPLGVAVGAAGAHLRAARYGIPRCFRPLDARPIGWHSARVPTAAAGLPATRPVAARTARRAYACRCRSRCRCQASL